MPAVAAAFFWLKCAVLVLGADALRRVARRALLTWAAYAVAGVAFLALVAFGAFFPAVVLAAGLLGWAAPGAFAGSGHGAAKDGPMAALDAVLATDPGRPARMAAGAGPAAWPCGTWTRTTMWSCARMRGRTALACTG